MVESFKDAGVVDGQSVEQNTEDDKDESGNSKGAANERPDELLILFHFNHLHHVGETEESSRC